MSIRVASLVLVAASLTASASAELVLNGDFATGDFWGWNTWGDTEFAFVESGYASFGPVDSWGGIVQSVDTVVGESYTFSFDLAAGGGGGLPSGFYADFGGQTRLSINNTDGFGWTHYSFEVVAMGPLSFIEFGFHHEADFFHLDNVSVTPTATPAPGALAFLGATGLVGTRRRRA